MSFQIATEVDHSYNLPHREHDDESTDIIGSPSESGISKLNSSQKHPKAKSRRYERSPDDQKCTLGTQALTTPLLLDDPQEQGSGWWHNLVGPRGNAQLEEIDLTDLATPSSNTLPAIQPPNSSGDRHSRSPAHSHSHSHAGTDGHNRHHGHSHGHCHPHDHQHEHDTPDERHLPTHPDDLQSLLPDGAIRYMTAMSGCAKKRFASTFQPPEDPCAPETSLACLLWSCALTIAESKGGHDDHHDHSHGDHDHGHGHSHVHTEQYHSHPPLPNSMADWADRCSEPCLNDDGTVCTELYHGVATRGHSHM